VGDENPPKENIGKTHIGPYALKRKTKVTQKGEIHVPESEDMELYAKEEDPYWAS